MLKMIPLNHHIVQIKEELIEYNADLGLITRYCVIVEQARFTLENLLYIWKTPELAE